MKFANLKNRKAIIISSFVGFFIFAGIISACFFHENIKDITAKQVFKYASYYFNGGAYDLNKAERWYKIALAIQPKLANTHYQLARINFVKGDFDKALSEINTELATNPQNVRSYYIKGLIDGYSADWQTAIADFKKFTEWSPQEWAGYNDLAWVQYKAKDFKAAEETISSALKKVTPNAFLLNGLGVAKLGQKQFDEAKNIFANALQLAQNLTVKDWLNAYPGNDPTEAEKKLEEFKNSLADNAGLADKKLAMGGVFTSACSASTYHQCSGTSCVAYTCDPDHTTCSNTCSNDCNCGATPPAPTNLSASCGGAGTSATLSWGATSCATLYAVRLNNTSEPWNGCTGNPPNNSCPDTSATSENVATYPGHTYHWWVHGCNGPSNCGNATGGDFTCAATNNAACLNISKPASIGAGQQFFANVTMQNTGTKVWNSDGTPHRLGSQNPQDNGRWGLGRVGLPWEPVNPGQSVTFGFTAAAPSTPGTYPFDWKMVEDGIEWFGQTCQSTMVVTCIPSCGGWGSCSVSCGGGTQSRTCTRADCSTYSESQSCNTQACPPGNFNLNLGGSIACNSIPLNWTAASGVQAYRILRGSPRVDISPYQPYTALNFTDTTVSQNTSYAYQIEAYNSSGTNRSNEISVTTPYCPPTLNFSANPTSIYQGQSVTLTWSSSYVTSCTASGAWSGSKPLNGSQVVVPLPPPSVTYNLQCSGPGGSVSGSTIINIAPLFLPDWKEVIPR